RIARRQRSPLFPYTTLFRSSLGATEAETLRHVVIPAIAAHVVTGLRLGLGVAWIVLVPAEMLGVRAGLGYAILDARDRLAYPERSEEHTSELQSRENLVCRL